MRNSKTFATWSILFLSGTFLQQALALEKSSPAKASKSALHAVAKTAGVKSEGASKPTKVVTSAESAGKVEAAPTVSLVAPNLTQLASDYRSTPDELSFSRYATYLRDLLALPQYTSADASQVVAANPSLHEFNVKVSETGIGNFRVWSFPRIAESHTVIFQTPARTTSIPLPQSISFREARIVGGAGAAAPATKVVARTKGKAQAAMASHSQTAASSGVSKSLVLIGADRTTSTLWFKAFQLVEGIPEATEVFSSLPAFFTQNVSGKAAFSGNDIVLTIQPPAPAKVEKREEDKVPGLVKDTVTKPVVAASSAGYKVILKFIGGKYTLAGHTTDDAPMSIALSFSQAVANSKPDIAKSWLVDSKLISIPKYLGLFGKVSPPMRLVPMSSSATGAARYRLVTSAKDDLIIEVGRITQAGRLKGQLAIRALFVAPPDVIAQKLSGTMVMPASAAVAAGPAATAGNADSISKPAAQPATSVKSATPAKLAKPATSAARKN